ncbi:MAG: hypothetical protein AAF637_05245 [Pseudomonadota bacterium]
MLAAAVLLSSMTLAADAEADAQAPGLWFAHAVLAEALGSEDENFPVDALVTLPSGARVCESLEFGGAIRLGAPEAGPYEIAIFPPGSGCEGDAVVKELVNVSAIDRAVLAAFVDLDGFATISKRATDGGAFGGTSRRECVRCEACLAECPAPVPPAASNECTDSCIATVCGPGCSVGLGADLSESLQCRFCLAQCPPSGQSQSTCEDSCYATVCGDPGVVGAGLGPTAGLERSKRHGRRSPSYLQQSAAVLVLKDIFPMVREVDGVAQVVVLSGIGGVIDHFEFPLDETMADEAPAD